MAKDQGDFSIDLENMTDDEVRQVIIQRFDEYPNIDTDDVDVAVRDGRVTLSGRVGTDAEVEVATSILDDILGLDDFENELVVDELRRDKAPAAADDAVAQDLETDDQIGEPLDQQTDTAEHLQENLETDTYGTHDVGTAVRDGTSYSPPDRPVGDGYGSRENH